MPGTMWIRRLNMGWFEFRKSYDDCDSDVEDKAFRKGFLTCLIVEAVIAVIVLNIYFIIN